MHRKKRQQGWSPLALRLLVWTAVGIAVCVFALGAWKELDSPSYNKVVGGFLGVRSRTSFQLDDASLAQAKTAGLNPTAVADAKAATDWIKDKYGVDIDLGIMLSIYEGESGSGTNLGDCTDGIYCSMHNPILNPAEEESAAKSMLKYLQENQVRDADPTAAAYILPDYSNYTGHRSAGEMGPHGFIPSTAWMVCQKGLSQNSDPEIASCDLWSTKTSFFAEAWYLYHIGYSSGLDHDAKFSALVHWNEAGSYRESLLTGADKVNASLGSGVVAQAYSNVVSFQGIWDLMDENEKWGLLAFLDETELSPIEVPDTGTSSVDESGTVSTSSSSTSSGTLGEAQKWLNIPVSKLRTISQVYSSTHDGIDFVCEPGADVIAVASGVVSKPAKGSIFMQDSLTYVGRPDWGNPLFIYVGDHLNTVYYHMESIYVQYGQWVNAGDPIGRCGHTGMSYTTEDGTRIYNTDASNHTHFSVVWTKVDHPIDGEEEWAGHKTFNPAIFLGKTVDPANLSALGVNP